MALSREEDERIMQFLDVEAPTDHADVLFVFGTRLLEPAYIAVDLFKRGVARYVTLTGGKNRLTGQNEARTHLEILAREGVPRERIIVEDASTNTLENVVFALPKIAERVDLDSIRRVVVITKWYHCRRAIMTLKRHMPDGIRYFTRSYEPEGISRADWYLDDVSSAPVLGNWQGIPEYLNRGHLAEIREEDGAFV